MVARLFIDIQQGNLIATGSKFDGALPKIIVGVDSSFDAANVEFASHSGFSIDVFG